ncbi:MAG: HAD family hydrolase [Pseudomonadota bacterium]
MTLAIFDLDNTLLGGDSDNLWCEFAWEKGLAQEPGFTEKKDAFYADYQSGNLDVDAYLRFALSTLKGRPLDELARWHRQFMQEKIDPIMLPQSLALIERHRKQGHHLLIITATNAFITRPIAHALGIDELIACEAEIVDGYYTGAPIGVPSFHTGKVSRLNTWLDEREMALTDAYFYSDSHNDLPLLELVTHPVAVDPDDILLARAKENGWPIISLRD